MVLGWYFAGLCLKWKLARLLVFISNIQNLMMYVFHSDLNRHLYMEGCQFSTKIPWQTFPLVLDCKGHLQFPAYDSNDIGTVLYNCPADFQLKICVVMVQSPFLISRQLLGIACLKQCRYSCVYDSFSNGEDLEDTVHIDQKPHTFQGILPSVCWGLKTLM